MPRTVALLLGSAAVGALLLAAIPRELPDVALATLIGGAWLAVVLALTLPSGSEMAGAELSRRLGHFRHALNALGDHPSREELERLLALARELGLRDDETAEERSQIQAAMDALALRDRLARGDLPLVQGVDALPPDDRCHFLCPVRFGRRRSDQFGHLLLTSGWLRFRGTLDVSVAWSEVSGVQRAGRELVITLQDSNRTLRFGCHTLEEATCGGVIAEYLASLSVARD